MRDTKLWITPALITNLCGRAAASLPPRIVSLAHNRCPQFLQIGFEKVVGDDQRLDGLTSVTAAHPIQLNPRWRVTIVHDQAEWKRKAWVLQELARDAWHTKAVTRSSEMLRAMVRAWCGRLAPGVGATLAALPDRVDHRGSSTIAAPGKRARAAETRAAAAAALAEMRAAAAGTAEKRAAAAFLTWRAEQKENAAKG